MVRLDTLQGLFLYTVDTILEIWNTLRYLGSGKRFAGFFFIPMVSVLSPFLALPAVTHVGGASAWASVAIGQSLGAAAATIVELGWGLNGPQRVARANARNRKQTLALSFGTKFMVLPLVTLLAAVVAYILSPQFQWTAALVAAGSSMAGLSLAWFFIGLGRPKMILLTDTLPRLGFVAVSAVLLYAGGPVLLYPLVGLVVPSAAAPLVGAIVSGVRRSDFAFFNFKRYLVAIKYQLTAMSGRLMSALYIALPVTLVSIVSPGSIALFAAAERLQRMCLAALTAAPNAMQGWVGRPPTRRGRLDRARTAVLANAAMGILAGVGFTLLAQPVSKLLFSGTVIVQFPLSALCGLLIAIVCTSRATGGLALVASRQIHIVSISAALGALIGVPGILVLARLMGPAGGLLGEIAAEAAVLGFQLFHWNRFRLAA